MQMFGEIKDLRLHVLRIPSYRDEPVYVSQSWLGVHVLLVDGTCVCTVWPCTKLIALSL